MRSYRFARFDAELRRLGEVSLNCLNDDDAMLVGGRLGWRVEVWEHGRPVGVAGQGAAVIPPPAFQPTAFNPFSRRVWRRRRAR